MQVVYAVEAGKVHHCEKGLLTMSLQADELDVMKLANLDY